MQQILYTDFISCNVTCFSSTRFLMPSPKYYHAFANPESSASSFPTRMPFLLLLLWLQLPITRWRKVARDQHSGVSESLHISLCSTSSKSFLFQNENCFSDLKKRAYPKREKGTHNFTRNNHLQHFGAKHSETIIILYVAFHITCFTHRSVHLIYCEHPPMSTAARSLTYRASFTCWSLLYAIMPWGCICSILWLICTYKSVSAILQPACSFPTLGKSDVSIESSYLGDPLPVCGERVPGGSQQTEPTPSQWSLWPLTKMSARHCSRHWTLVYTTHTKLTHAFACRSCVRVSNTYSS